MRPATIKYPANQLLNIKPKLEDFLKYTKDVDYSVQLTERNGVKYFVNLFMKKGADIGRWLSAFASLSLNRKDTKYAKFREDSLRNFAYFVSLRLSERLANSINLINTSTINHKITPVFHPRHENL